MFRAQVELRRLHRDAEWGVAGVVVEGRWHAMTERTELPTVREHSAGLTRFENLPPILAADGTRAVAVARWVAMGQPFRLWARLPHAGTRNPRPSFRVTP